MAMYVTFSQTSPFDSVAIAIIEWHRQRIENYRLITSNIVYRKVLESFRYLNNSLLIKYFIVSTCELFARVQRVY
jgi:hypothetical protein